LWEAALNNKKGLTQECFDRLLKFLGPDRESAANLYEAIRRRLIQIFIHRGCLDPDELADRTFDRVCERIEEIAPRYEGGNPALYFYGVANNIYLETFRKQSVPPLTFFDPGPDVEITYQCLAECLGGVSQQERDMVLDYYRGDGLDRIENRKRIAERLSISQRALRLRIFRLLPRLEMCITDCLDRRRLTGTA
jgi:DNA-directed RNA polymerase specialized sigma24 family protein